MPYRLVQFVAGVPIWVGVVNVLGDVLWLVAYILIIRQGFKDRTYGVPMLCVALNFTWEFIYAVQFPFPITIIEALRWAWLLTDAVIVYQLFRYGRDSQTVPLIKQYFFPIAIAMFASTYIAQLTFHYSYSLIDNWGGLDAYMINLVMSILFVFLYFSRPGLQGISLGAAWAKMLGTGVLSLGSCFLITDWVKSGFMVYLFLTIFVIDVTYIVLLYRARAAAAGRAGDRGILIAA
jgi:hypothetical protein